MEENKACGGIKWRWIAVAVMVIAIAVSLLAVGVTGYKLGHARGYDLLEKEIVYAIALNKSNNVGKFLVAKLDNGATLIALKELYVSAEVQK